MLITITGIDGAGKSTLTRALARQLSELGHDAILLDRWEILDTALHPSAEFVQTDLKRLRKNVADMPPPSRLYFLLWTMAMTVHRHLAAARKDQLFIFDSYWTKHLAVEIAYGLDAGDAYNATSLLPRSDLTILLDLPPHIALQRKAGDLSPYECGMDPVCAERSFLAHQAKVASLLSNFAVEERWHKTNGERSQGDILQEVLNVILRRL